MTTPRTTAFYPYLHSWLRSFLLGIVGFMVAFGVTSWFLYGMIKDIFLTVSIRAFVVKIREKRKVSSRR